MPSYIPPLSSVLQPEWLHDETIGVLLHAVGAIDAFPSSKAFVGALRLSVNLCFSLHCSLVDFRSPRALVLESSCYPLVLLLLAVVFKSLMFLHSTRLLGVTLLGFPRCIISSSVFSPFHLLLLRSFFHFFQTFMREEVSEVVTSLTGHG